jgi:ABC-type Fe3+-siderophore transport system permease subunit
VLLRRKPENTVVVNLAPLLVVASLALGAVLTVTRRNELADRFGYNVSGVIGMVSALFFVVLLSHIQPRQDFAGAGVTYLEYFYFMMYLVLMAVATNAFLISTRPHRHAATRELGDNMVFKLA